MTSSATSSLLPFTPSSTDPSYTPPQPEDSSSFGEVMQQHSDATPAGKSQDTKSNSSDTENPAAQDGTQDDSTSKADSTTPTPAATPKSGGGHAAHGKKAPPSPSTAGAATTATNGTLKSMLVRATVLANAGAEGKSTPAKPTQTEPENGDLSALIAQALALAGKQSPTAAKTDATTAQEATSDTGTTSSEGTASLSTLLAEALSLATGGAATGATTAAGSGKDVHFTTTGKGSSTSSTKEKKSASEESKGSFLQSGPGTTPTAADLLASLTAATATSTQSNSSQTLATSADGKKSTGDLLAKIGSSTAGTANVEKKLTMNAEQNLSTILNGTGTTTTTQPPVSDMQIKLSSNNNFDQALKTVLHVASLNEATQSRAATRVAIELQTPPGAVVNVYVTKTNDQWRAQLSTNDPAALSWVQDKVSSLKQTTDAGVEVKWLPPQLESTTVSSGDGANLGWDRGGQGQSPYQQDENGGQRQQDDDDTAGFSESLATSGRSS